MRGVEEEEENCQPPAIQYRRLVMTSIEIIPQVSLSFSMPNDVNAVVVCNCKIRLFVDVRTPKTQNVQIW